jgi:hypothetical protein
VETEYDLGGIRILGFGLKDDIFVILEELSQDSEGALLVDQTVRHYDASGNFLDVARVPFSEQYIYVQQGVALGPEGSVYFLATRPDRVEIWRLSFEQSIPTILFEKSKFNNSPKRGQNAS